MKNLQKMGGVAALVEAITYIIGMALFVTVLAPYVAADLDAAQKVAFLAENQTIMYVCNLIIYVVFGGFLVVLALALHEHLKTEESAMMQVATAFGLIWAGLVIASGMVFNVGCLGTVVELYAKDTAQATSAWVAIAAVQDGLGGGNEIVGGLWSLLLSWAALRAGKLPKALNYLGVAIGVAGLVTVVPALTDVGALFGLSQIVWFVWLGIVMLRSSSSAAA